MHADFVLDVTLKTEGIPVSESGSTSGVVEGIFITDAGAAPMQSHDSVEVMEGKGIKGDRYSVHEGTFSDAPRGGKHVTLIEAEAIEAACRDYDISFTAEDTRRNIVTRGVALNHLVGKKFKVGDVTLEGERLAEPCGHIKKLSGVDQIMKSLIHRGGLRCVALDSGAVNVGDSIQPVG